MANQIAANFREHDLEQAPTEVATHIGTFWSSSMRADLFAYADGGGEGLDPAVIAALGLMRPPTS